jgi:hypothetical protein
MTPHTSAASEAPKAGQLSYLRDLALQTGTTFSLPRTRRQASCEIERLKKLKARRGTHVEAHRETDPAEQPYATAVEAGEVSGYGSSATWRASSHAVVSAADTRSRVGELTELARYEVSSGERVLYGQRIDGCVRITDRPVSGSVRSYLVERELERDGYSALNALVADYVQQAAELDAVPMASSLVRRKLEHAASDA